ncbi:MAG: dephospho-CoA kinase [Saprospiraceae bacterium]|jgi:dephospho-CoA kinase
MSDHELLRIGLTGGIGSGKTTCAAIFEALGIPVYYSDARAKAIMNTNDQLRTELKEVFGEESYLSDGSLNRSYLSRLIFKDNSNIAKINSIVHPAVRNDFIKWCEENITSQYVLQESALMFETGSYKSFDKNILVDASEEIRIDRVMKRDGIPAEQVRERMAKQLLSSDKRKLADFIIENDGNQGLVKQVVAIHLSILEL